jgi:hypothetical protein
MLIKFSLIFAYFMIKIGGFVLYPTLQFFINPLLDLQFSSPPSIQPFSPWPWFDAQLLLAQYMLDFDLAQSCRVVDQEGVFQISHKRIHLRNCDDANETHPRKFQAVRENRLPDIGLY